MNPQLADLNRIGGANPGGGLSLWFAPAYDIHVWPVIMNGLVQSEAQFYEGRRWLQLAVTENKLSYDEDSGSDAQGETIKVSIKGMSRGDDPLVRTQLAMMQQLNRFTVRFTDNSGLTRIAGTKSERLTFSYKFTTGESMPGMRGYSFEFAGTFTLPPAVQP